MANQIDNQSYEGYTNFATFEVAVTFANSVGLREDADVHIKRFGEFTRNSAHRFVKIYWKDRTPSGRSLREVNFDEVAVVFNPEPVDDDDLDSWIAEVVKTKRLIRQWSLLQQI